MKAKAEEETEADGEESPAYWLMKAEPESRLEKGKDIKFSIDDLKTANEPEGWDGMYCFDIDLAIIANSVSAGVRNHVGK